MNSATVDLEIREKVALAPLTTLGVGGPARYFAEATTEAHVRKALGYARERDLSVFVLGGGSNLLVSDDGFPGLVLRMGLRGSAARQEGESVLVTAAAGEDWDAFVGYCVERNLAGVECLSGIPGFVGGAPVQNIGAYGQEVSETIAAVRVLERRSGEIVDLPSSACGFAYRRSIFNTTERDRYIVLTVTFALTEGGVPALRYGDIQRYFAEWTELPSLADVRRAVLEVRARKSMVLREGDPDCRSAGSFFKNPVVSGEEFARIADAARALGAIAPGEMPPHYPDAGGVKVPAAWLIERAGFTRGYSRGRAGLSSKHTLAIVNRGDATARDILALVDEIRDGVRSRFGATLHPEPVFVGFDGALRSPLRP